MIPAMIFMTLYRTLLQMWSPEMINRIPPTIKRLSFA